MEVLASLDLMTAMTESSFRFYVFLCPCFNFLPRGLLVSNKATRASRHGKFDIRAESVSLTPPFGGNGPDSSDGRHESRH